jgi:hypothetical protein
METSTRQTPKYSVKHHFIQFLSNFSYYTKMYWIELEHEGS